jgi:transposase InsO family protein
MEFDNIVCGSGGFHAVTKIFSDNLHLYVDAACSTESEGSRSDNGPEFIAKALKGWLADAGCKTIYIEPGSPWENSYFESFNGKYRFICLNTND